MMWRETLQSLQVELAEVRQERQRQAREEEAERQDQRRQLTQLAETLEMSRLVEEMNAVLLRGGGSVESYSSWDPPDEEEDDDDLLHLGDGAEEEDADYVSAVLTWEEDGDREIAVDLGMSDEGLYLQVNGIDIRPERGALEQALVEAFRAELQV